MQPGMPKSNESYNATNPLYIEGGTITTAWKAVKNRLGKEFCDSKRVDSRENCFSG